MDTDVEAAVKRLRDNVKEAQGNSDKLQKFIDMLDAKIAEMAKEGTACSDSSSDSGTESSEPDQS
jgi:prefoldin subunit 5